MIIIKRGSSFHARSKPVLNIFLLPRQERRNRNKGKYEYSSDVFHAFVSSF